ncbi:MAG: hypothetical protein AAF805_00910 [Planctomycetota bacterium]
MRYTLRQAALPYAILVVTIAGLMCWYCRAWNLDGRKPLLDVSLESKSADTSGGRVDGGDARGEFVK